MNKEEFISAIADILQTDKKIGFSSVLDDLSEWDSLAKIALIAFADKQFNLQMTFNDIAEMKTVEDIAKKVKL